MSGARGKSKKIPQEEKESGAGGKPTKFPQAKKEEIFFHYADFFRDQQKVPAKSDSFWSEVKEQFKLHKSVILDSITSQCI